MSSNVVDDEKVEASFVVVDGLSVSIVLVWDVNPKSIVDDKEVVSAFAVVDSVSSEPLVVVCVIPAPIDVVVCIEPDDVCIEPDDDDDVIRVVVNPNTVVVDCTAPEDVVTRVIVTGIPLVVAVKTRLEVVELRTVVALPLEPVVTPPEHCARVQMSRQFT